MNISSVETFNLFLVGVFLMGGVGARGAEQPPNRWVEISKDPAGGRPGSAIRYASSDQGFFLWGFMNSDPDLPQEQPLMEIPEYDMVRFDLSVSRWRNHLPLLMEKEWSRKLPLAYVPRTYSGITTGSERTVLRGAAEEEQGVPRPDLNIVFDQVTYRLENNSLYYFTGGLTAVYEVGRRRWTDLRPPHSPPPVLGGSVAYNPVRDELVLFGGGHIAERGPDGPCRGYTGTWVYGIKANDWYPLPLTPQPPPRMNTRMVCDTRNQVLVLFGGDGQRFYLGDTWLFDLKTRTWRASKARYGPEPRAGHFIVYDPETGSVIIGGGYNRRDLTDMWAYDAAADRWQRLNGEVPTGFYISADIAPAERTIVLVTNTQTPGDRTSCNILYPVRTTYTYHIAAARLAAAGDPPRSHEPMPKRDPADLQGMEPDTARRQAQEARLKNLRDNEWVLLADPGRGAPTRTWGSATFDSGHGQILYWGGGHCGYEGNDFDAYDVAEHTWLGEPTPEYPERLWNRGVRLAGMTFDGRPWTDHGRKIYAYDPVSKKVIMVPRFRLTTGYEPDWMRSYPTEDHTAPDALVQTPSSYRKSITYSYDPSTRDWNVIGPGPAGVDALVTTRHGVMGVNVDWPGRENDAGYQFPWDPAQPSDNAIFLLRGARWERISKGQPSPQNLFEMTSMAYDSKRDQVVLHGGGKRRDELWVFDIKTLAWRNMQAKVASPAGTNPPGCTRESVYIPGEDVVLIIGDGGRTWEYSPAENAWRQVDLGVSGGEDLLRTTGQNRAVVYDPKRDLVFLILGPGGNEGVPAMAVTRLGKAAVFALRYRRAAARSATER